VVNEYFTTIKPELLPLKWLGLNPFYCFFLKALPTAMPAVAILQGLRDNK
jgi:hypothetical protein